MPLTCIIVDDEPLAVKLMESFVAKTPDLELLDSYTDSVEAINAVKELKPNLLFLDIQMPDLNGMELAHMIPTETRVVFTTAFKEYAFESYEVSALDFLLKPIRYNKFIAAVDKAKLHFSNRTETITKPQSVFVRVDGELRNITISDVTALANILLEKSVNGSSLVYADVNKSKSVTISDITPLNNMILGDVSNAKGGYGYSLRRNANYDALLSMDDVQLNAGTATQQSIALDGVYRYVCFQMDIDVPAGIDIQNVVNAEGTDAHIVEWNKLKNGMYRIIGYSHDNASVRDGNLADITFRASADMRDGIYPFHVRNILLGRADGSEVTIDNIKSNIIVGNATSNYELQITNYPQQQSIYDLQGRKLNSASAMKSGLYINNGKKVIKK